MSDIKQLHDALGQAIALNKTLSRELAEIEFDHVKLCAIVCRVSETRDMFDGLYDSAYAPLVDLFDAILGKGDRSFEDMLALMRNYRECRGMSESTAGDVLEDDEVRFTTEGVEALSESVVEALLGSDDKPEALLVNIFSKENAEPPVETSELDDPSHLDVDPTADICGTVDVADDTSTTEALSNIKKIRKQQKPKKPKESLNDAE